MRGAQMPRIFDNRGPHIAGQRTLSGGMWSVVLALIPATIAATVFFGPYALYLVVSCAVTAALIEIPFRPSVYRLRRPFGDGSAFLAGQLLGLSLAPGSPWWIPLFGAGLVVLLGKQIFGGLGNNLFNPALVARAILLLAFPALVTEWRLPFGYDTVTLATPLDGAPSGLVALFLGAVAGSIGETSALALLLGGGFLLQRGMLKWRIPLAYLLAAMATAHFLGESPLHTILSGSLLFGAVYMATDWVTSPVGRSACTVYGIGCGVATVLIRFWGLYPEGVTFAILLMNGLRPVLEWVVSDVRFGQVERLAHRRAIWGVGATVLVLVLATGYFSMHTRDVLHRYYVDARVRQDLRDFFPPGSRYVHAYPVQQEGVVVERVYAREGPVGYLVYTSSAGFYGPIQMVTVLDDEERIVGLRVREHEESATLGGLIRRPSFLRQFLRLNTATSDLAVDRLHAITGATISSRAVATAITQALRFRDEPAAPSRASGTWEDGTWEGTGSGYQGRIDVSVTVTGGRITSIDIQGHRETARLAEPAFARLVEAVLAGQDLGVDAISGATSSSRGLLDAVRHALEP